MEAAVELIGVRKNFGPVEALRGVDLAIAPGQSIAILGPNGAGKTTAISLMTGLRKPSAGQARLFGLAPGDRRARSRAGVMLQESGVNPALRVRELVQLFASYYPRPMPVARAIALAGLEEKAGEATAKLSGGQRQRLYFALSICGDPELLFLDEPTVGMDVEARQHFLSTIKEFSKAGKTIVLTTHYLEEADQLADRIVVIDHGLVIADATPVQIKSQVAGKRVSFRSPAAPDLAGLDATALRVEGESVSFLTNQPESVLRELFRRGAEIAELEVRGADLEEAFLSLTGAAAARKEAVS